MQKLYFLIAILCIGCKFVSSTRSDEKVVNGTLAKNGEFPEVLALVFSDGKFYSICTAVKISPTALLTAGHCFNSSTKVFITNESNVFADFFAAGHEAKKTYEIRQYMHPSLPQPYPSLKRSQYVDVAVFEILNLNPKSDFAKYNISDLNFQTTPSGVNATLVGYGCDNLFTQENDGKKRHAVFTTLSRDESWALYNQYAAFGKKENGTVLDAFSNYLVFAGQQSGSDTFSPSGCPGDSGGPLLANGQVIGFVSGAGKLIKDEKKKTTFSPYWYAARVSAAKDFIGPFLLKN